MIQQDDADANGEPHRLLDVVQDRTEPRVFPVYQQDGKPAGYYWGRAGLQLTDKDSHGTR